MGDPFDAKTDVGPLATPDAVKDIDGDVQKTIQAGAKLLTGGKPVAGPGNFYQPTVLTNIPKDSPAYREEFFGPVASIFRVKNVDDAWPSPMTAASASAPAPGPTIPPSASASSMTSKQAWFSSIKWSLSDARLPFGGVKASGHGRELGPYGIREFTNAKTVWIRDLG